MNRIGCLVATLVCSALCAFAAAPYEGWQHAGSIYLLTTPEGANLPASAWVEGFPVLVRLHQESFDFSQAKAHGEDVRFSTSTGVPLAYQMEEWDAAKGTACIWVRIPVIKGNERQEMRVHWGRPDAVSESNGRAVFNESNGYLSVWHMNEPVKDEVGTLESRDVDTTPVAGVVGPARHLAGKQGVFGGEKITRYPSGAESHSSEAWFRAGKPNGRILAWGNEQAQGKVVTQFRSPPHISVDCYFSDGNVQGGSTLSLGRWVQVVHTYQKGDARVYVNGILDGASTSRAAPLAIRNPARLWIGGWYHDYDFIGDIDEVRISNVARSADWVRLQYENQKPLQSLTGPVVRPGAAFSVSSGPVTVLEGKSVTISAEAGGAQKIYWILKNEARETPVAVDRYQFTFDAGRVDGTQTATLRFKAIYPNEVRTRDIPITIQEDIPEPVFTLKAPAKWDGRSTVEVVPQVANLGELQRKGAGELRITWSVSDLAVTQETRPGKLILTRAQNSGRLTVTATVQNGGKPTTQSTTIVVTEPKVDAWIARTPVPDEKPEDNQFYARNDRNEGTLFYNGTLNEAADSVFLKVFADGRLFKKETRRLSADKSYAFTVKLKPGLMRYTVEFGSRNAAHETVLHTVTNVVCGDAYLIQGQSNAVATDWGKDNPTFHSEWIRTFGSMSGSPNGVSLWGDAVHRSRDAEKLQIGYWGMELARRLVENHQIPICILNGAVGGTRIDQHQRNPENPVDMTTIYGRLLLRVRQAKLTHGIRGVFWHQGENDQGADGPTGGFGWETYRQYFIDLAAAWKQDYPNIQHYYVFQIWPKSCAMGIDGSDNRLREVQRTLPSAFSRMSILSTLGIEPPGGCHFPSAGYAEFARLLCPLVERDHYGKVFDTSITPPDLKRCYCAGGKQDEIAMEFDQPVKWDDALANQFLLDGETGRVASGSVAGNVVTLKLSAPSAARKLTYLDSKSWSQKNLLRGENGIAALTFCEVPILPAPAPPRAEAAWPKRLIGYSAGFQQGAAGPVRQDAAKREERGDHWSFQPVARPALPKTKDKAWPRNEVDRMILARLEREGLTPAPEADRVTWLRRVSFDLVGLPPSPEQVEAFVQDARHDARERVVDALLNSPRYGERWAQHWLDVVRYADTHGFEVNTERPNAWPYRDYVIEAFNDDTPYDRFIREQIAGDALGQDAATGFLVTASVLLPGQIGQDEASKRLARQDSLDEIVVNTGQTFLGLSVGCARCHDHKFDPISARDYYSMQAFFAGVEYGDRELRTPEALARRTEAALLSKRVAEIEKNLAGFEPLARVGSARSVSVPPPRAPVNAAMNTDRFAPVQARRLRFTIKETNNLEPCIDELEVFDTDSRNVALASTGARVTSSGDTVVADRHELRQINDGQYGNSRSWMSNEKGRGWVILEFPREHTIDRVVWGRDREGKFSDRLATNYLVEVAGASGEWRPVADSTNRLGTVPGKETSRSPTFSTAGLNAEEARRADALLAERKALEARIASAAAGQLVFAGTFRKPDDIHLLNRGDPEQPKEEVTPAVLSVLGSVKLPQGTAEQQRRLALADWIASPQNPLTARVMVNRIWQGHFGTGLVETPSDFGRNGARPSHPELLDWLASEFVRSGWSVKHMHRLIVLSAAYRQSSVVSNRYSVIRSESRRHGARNLITAYSKASRIDADVRLLWRFPSRRLESEAIRDSMLAVSGRLNLKMGGRGFDLFNNRGGLSGFKAVESFSGDGLRRMIYAHKVRREREAVFGVFDCPDAGQSTARRRESTTPIQALNLFNSRFTLEQADAFAARVKAEAGDDITQQIRRAYQTALSRGPSRSEIADAAPAVRAYGLATLCRALFNSNEFLFIP